DDRAGPVLLRLDPPRHHVVVARRRAALPIEEVIAVLRRLLHIHVERYEGVGPLLDRHLGPVGLDAELPRVEDVVLVDREAAGEFAGMDDVGDDLDMPGLDIPTSNGFFLSGKNTLGVSVGRCPLIVWNGPSPRPL